MRQPLPLDCRPAPSTSTPALAISSWKPIISDISASEGITPASESFVALTRIMNFIAISLRLRGLHPLVEWRGGQSTSARKIFQPLGEEAALRLLAGKGEGALVGAPGFVQPAGAPAKIGAGRVGQMVVVKLFH